MDKVLITGATSMIGVALIEYLLKHGCEVTGIVRPESKHCFRLPVHPKLTVIQKESKELLQLAASLTQEYDAFYHLAWSNTGSMRDTDTLGQIDNIRMTLEALELCARIGCDTFIGAGSQAEFGPKTEGPIGRHSSEDPITAYGICKLAAGKLAIVRGTELGIRCIWPRIFSVFGPNDRDSSLLSYVIRSLKDHKTPLLTDGTQIWDYLYAADAAKALYLIGKEGLSGKKYCIGSGIGKPLREYVDFIKLKMQSDAEIGYGEIPMQENAVRYLVADTKELFEDTGFKPDYTFEDGIREMLRV